MKSKMVLLGAAILAIGLMVMPYTINAYVGQTHYWQYDGQFATWSSGTPPTNCSRCHGSTTGDDTSGNAAAYHAAKPCSDCHAPVAATNTHTNVTIPTCVQGGCHDTVDDEFAIATEPHYEMNSSAIADDDLAKVGSPNEACIACHSNVTVSVTFVWSEAQGTINIDATGGAASWTTVDYY